MNILKYFMCLMSGTAIGLITGYIAGLKKDIYLETKSHESLKNNYDFPISDFNKDLKELIQNYHIRLNELTCQVQERVEELKIINKENE